MATQESRLRDLVARIASEFVSVYSKIGDITTLTTSAKNSVVAAINSLKTEVNGKQANLGYTPENVANKGVAGGYASLDANAKVPAAQLPSYVDDVLEYDKQTSFPATGEAGKLYVALDTNRVYRWSGSTYIRIVASPGTTDEITEGTTNLFFTNARAQAAAKLIFGEPDVDYVAVFNSALVA